MTTYNVYCDESCHLEHDGQPTMVLGAVWCPSDKTRGVSEQVRKIKARHGLSPRFEIKWAKVSPVKREFYEDVLDYFFDERALHFRSLVALDKSKLQHQAFAQDHDTWYYKMYFEMLKVILDRRDCYRIYLDIKDTRGRSKVAKLHEVLCSSLGDSSTSIIERVQIIRSHESDIMQLVDLLVGTVSYANRGLSENRGKAALVEKMRQRSRYDLTKTTSYAEDKVNLFIWSPTEGRE